MKLHGVFGAENVKNQNFGYQFGVISKINAIFAARTLSHKNMVIVSTRDFRTNQSRYLEMVKRGEEVILRSRSGSFRLTPVKGNDIEEKPDLTNELRNAIIEIKEVLAGRKSLDTLDSVIETL